MSIGRQPETKAQAQTILKELAKATGYREYDLYHFAAQSDKLAIGLFLRCPRSFDWKGFRDCIDDTRSRRVVFWWIFLVSSILFIGPKFVKALLENDYSDLDDII